LTFHDTVGEYLFKKHVPEQADYKTAYEDMCSVKSGKQMDYQEMGMWGIRKKLLFYSEAFPISGSLMCFLLLLIK
jgi:hypothetical protein